MPGLFHTVANTPFRVKLGTTLAVVVFACLPAAADSITFSALTATSASLGSSPNLSTFSITGSTQQLPLSTKKPLSADLVANISAAANLGVGTYTGSATSNLVLTNASGATQSQLVTFNVTDDVTSRLVHGPHNTTTTVFTQTFSYSTSSPLYAFAFPGYMVDVTFSPFSQDVQNGTQTTAAASLLYTDPPSAIPEPSSLLLLGTALLAVGGILRRKIRP